jgi:hypothetical protein
VFFKEPYHATDVGGLSLFSSGPNRSGAMGLVFVLRQSPQLLQVLPSPVTFADGCCVCLTSDSEWKTVGHFNTILDTMDSTAITPIEPFFENVNQAILAKDTTMQMVLI